MAKEKERKEEEKSKKAKTAAKVQVKANQNLGKKAAKEKNSADKKSKRGLKMFNKYSSVNRTKVEKKKLS